MPPKRTTTTTRKARSTTAATRGRVAVTNGPVVAAPVVPAPIIATGAGDPASTGGPDVLALQIELQTLKDQLAQAQTANTAAVAAVAAAAGNQVNLTPVATIPKPLGSAGGGKKGFHLQEEMGLDGSDDGRKKYTMILATIRELVHATRINPYKKYRMISAEDLVKIFQSARRIHPYLNKFDNDWATAEIVKQYLSSVRRYGRRMGYITDPDADVDLPPIDQM